MQDTEQELVVYTSDIRVYFLQTNIQPHPSKFESKLVLIASEPISQALVFHVSSRIWCRDHGRNFSLSMAVLVGHVEEIS
jgi:hypothetical protein